MASQKRTPGKLAQPNSAPAHPTPSGNPPEAASAEQTSDYTRRAGGWVLTDRGWVRESES